MYSVSRSKKISLRASSRARDLFFFSWGEGVGGEKGAFLSLLGSADLLRNCSPISAYTNTPKSNKGYDLVPKNRTTNKTVYK